MTLPKQTTDIASDRVASAPYNFVPLPEKVVAAATKPKELPRHDRYDADRLSGYFDVHLTTRSPLYVRGALPLEDFLQAERGVLVDDLNEDDATFRDLPGNTPDFFYQSDPESPLIPGSSLRGMLRFYLSIVSYGKLQPVSERRLSFRSLGGSKIGSKYKSVTGNGKEVKTGFLQKRGGQYKIQPCKPVRVSIEDHDLTALYDGNVPCWESPEGSEYHQHASVSVQNTHETEDISPSHMDKLVEKWEMGDAGEQGCLVLAGRFGGQKKFEHVFLYPEVVEDEDPSLMDVDSSLVEEFNSDEQITRFERKAYRKNKPVENARKRDGALRRDLRPRPEDEYYGEPVHYIPEDETSEDGTSDVQFFGRAVLFRLPYEHSPGESLPRAHSDASIYDYAEALFGFVRSGENVYKDFRDRGGTDAEWEDRAECYEQGGRGRAYAGRVAVTPAATVPGQGDVRAQRALVPRILSSPEPTTVQHYLVQKSDEKRKIKTYDDAGGYDHGRGEPETALRGHKLYWHQGRVSPGKVKADPEDLEYDDSQHTYIRPVTPESRFRFRVRFDNLSEAELGALCWALRPEGDPEVMHGAHVGEGTPSPSEDELPDTGYFHKLGMGRPLGLGSVQLDAQLYLTNRTERYQTLFAETGTADVCRWHDGTRRASEKERDDFRTAFEDDVRDQLDSGGWWTGGDEAPLHKQPRIQDLLTLMRWPRQSPEEPEKDDPKRYLRDKEHPRPNTRYMQIELDERGGEDEYEERPVLPPPVTFDDQRESPPVVQLPLNPLQSAGSGQRTLGRVEHYERGEEGYITNPNESNIRFEPEDIDENSGPIRQEEIVSFFLTTKDEPKQVYRETNASARELMQDPPTADPPQGGGPRQPAPNTAEAPNQKATQRKKGINERQTGTVKWFNPEEGYGFIVPDPECVFQSDDADEDDVFVHISEISGNDLPEDQRVEYDVERTDKGLNAKNVTVMR